MTKQNNGNTLIYKQNLQNCCQILLYKFHTFGIFVDDNGLQSVIT